MASSFCSKPQTAQEGGRQVTRNRQHYSLSVMIAAAVIGKIDVRNWQASDEPHADKLAERLMRFTSSPHPTLVWGVRR